MKSKSETQEQAYLSSAETNLHESLMLKMTRGDGGPKYPSFVGEFLANEISPYQ